jgi:carboxypeptidase Q
MKKIFKISLLFFLSTLALVAQDKEAIIEGIIKEANDNSQLENLGHELMDVIGPRLVGTPQMKQANDWAVAKYKSWEFLPEMKSGVNGEVGNVE